MFAGVGSFVRAIESREPTEVISHHSKAVNKKKTAPFIVLPDCRCRWHTLLFSTPAFITAVPFWGQTTRISSSLPSKRDCAPKGVNRPSNLSSEKIVPRVPWHPESEWRLLGHIKACHGPTQKGRLGPSTVDVMGRGPSRPIKFWWAWPVNVYLGGPGLSNLNWVGRGLARPVPIIFQRMGRGIPFSKIPGPAWPGPARPIKNPAYLSPMPGYQKPP